MGKSVQPEWCLSLPIQQQSVLLLASRGPDGISKSHPAKHIHRAYRACVLIGAYEGHELAYGEGSIYNTFMGLDLFSIDELWTPAVNNYFDQVDSLPLHYHMHFLHGIEILGYKHPDPRISNKWLSFYFMGCEALHLHPEAEDDMDARLCDWNQDHWEDPVVTLK